MSYCPTAIVAAKSAVSAAHPGHQVGRNRRQSEEHVRPRDHVDPGRDHRGGVDQGRDRRRSGHGVRQPDVQGQLRRLARRPQQQKERDGRRHAGHRRPGGSGPLEDLVETQTPEGTEGEEHGYQEAEVADAIRDEGLLPGQGVPDPVLALLVPESDQQI